MKDQVNDLSFEGEKIFIGIDVHKKQWKVSILTEHIDYKTFSQDPDPGLLHQYLKKHFPGAEYHCAYEAGFSGFWAYDRLTELGVRTIVANAADIPTTDKEKRQKEDKRDSRKIAKCLKAGTLTPIRVPSKKNREDRGLLRTRRAIVKDLQRNKNRIKAMLHFHGVECPKRFTQQSNHWSQAFMEWLENIELSEDSGNFSLRMFIENAKFLREELLKMNRKIRELSQHPHYAREAKLLRSIPGIGTITAMTLLTELESIHYYKDLDRLCSYIGLVPSSNSSGEKDRVGEITPRGKGPLRSLLIESTWVAVRNDPTLTKKYNQLCGRKKPNDAITTVAKKLINRIRYVLINQKEYRIMSN